MQNLIFFKACEKKDKCCKTQNKLMKQTPHSSSNTYYSLTAKPENRSCTYKVYPVTEAVFQTLFLIIDLKLYQSFLRTRNIYDNNIHYPDIGYGNTFLLFSNGRWANPHSEPVPSSCPPPYAKLAVSSEWMDCNVPDYLSCLLFFVFFFAISEMQVFTSHSAVDRITRFLLT